MQLFYFILLINVWSIIGINLDHHTSRIAIGEASSRTNMPKFLLLSTHTKHGTAKDNIPSIKVTFSDGTEDFTVLKHHNPFPKSKSWNPSTSCTYSGHMRSNPRELIAVTGCIQKENDKMYVTLLSKRSPHHIRFSIDGKGYVSLHHQDLLFANPDNVEDNAEDDEEVRSTNHHYGDPVTGRPAAKKEEEPTPEKAPRPENKRVIDPLTGETKVTHDAADVDYSIDYSKRVPFAMELSMRLGYDDGFHDSFDTKKEREDYLAAVMTHVEPYYRIESFHHHIYFNIEETLHIPLVMNLSTHQNSEEFAANVAIGWVAENNDPETGLYAFVSGSRNDWGVYGVGVPQSVCALNGTSPIKTSVSYAKRDRTPVETAWIMTHQIARNIGIKLPWVFRTTQEGARVRKCLQSSNGAPIDCEQCESYGPNPEDQCCSGIMSMGLNKVNAQMDWSRCSVKTFEEEYVFHRWQRQRCLPGVPPRTDDYPTPPPTIAAPTAESRFQPTASPPAQFESTTQWQWKERSLVLDEGEDAVNKDAIDEELDSRKGLSLGFSGRTLQECEHACETLVQCHSITYREIDGACYWKKKCVTMDEPADPDPVPGWKSYFMPNDGICGTASPTSPTSPPTYPPTRPYKEKKYHNAHAFNEKKYQNTHV